MPVRPGGARVAVLLLVLPLWGCRSYHPDPLDLTAHRRAWHARSADDVAVEDFARALRARGDAAPLEFEPHDGLSLPEAEVVALVFNPDLRLARLRAGVTAAGAEAAGAPHDPQFGLDLLYITESVPDRWIVGPSLAFTIPLSGRLDAERGRSTAAMHEALAVVAEAEWNLRFDVRETWRAWSAATYRREETQTVLRAVETLEQSTASLAEAGEMLRTEAALFAIERAQRSAECIHLQAEAARLELRLRSLLGLSPDAPVIFLPATEPASAPEPTLDELAKRNLELVRLRHAYDVAERTLEREIRKQYPDLTLGPAYESDEGQSRIGFTGGLPLPIFNANRRGIAEADAERTLARATFETAYERLAGNLAAALVEVRAARALRADVERTIIPLVDRQLTDATRALELGEGKGLVLLESLVRAHHIRRQLIDLQLREARAAAAVERLLGPPPSPPPAPTPTAPPSEGEETP